MLKIFAEQAFGHDGNEEYEKLFSIISILMRSSYK